MQIVINERIYIKKKEVSRELKRLLVDNYRFSIPNYQTQTPDIINLMGISGDSFTFPPNLDKMLDILKDFEVEVIDERYSDSLGGAVQTGIKLRPAQEEVFGKLAECNFNAIITAGTGFGKTLLSIYYAQELDTTSLFVGAQTAMIDNFRKDCAKFGIPDEMVTRVDTDWLRKGAKATPFMYCTLKSLTNPEIQEALKDKVGVLTADEVHKGCVTGETYRNALYSINPKHRVYLSATHEVGVKGLSETALSSNIIDSDEQIDYKIDIETLIMEPSAEAEMGYWKTDSSHERKEALYCDHAVKNVVALVAHLVKREGRGVLVFLEHRETHGKLAKFLRERFGFKVGVMNSDTKASERKEVVDNFDRGDFDIIIGGTSVTQAVSFYRVSAVVDMSVSLNNNNLTQLIGRLKRKDDEVCDKNKLFLKVCFEGLNDRKWKSSMRLMKSFPYTECFKSISCDNLLEGYREGVLSKV